MADRADRDADDRQIAAWRLAAFVVVLGCMLAGPIAKQVLHRGSGLLHGWTMFSGRGLGDLDVDYYQVQDGQRTKLAWGAMLLEAGRREQLLRHTRSLQSRRRTLARSMTKLHEVATVGAKLCELLPVGAELHARVRRATSAGWSQPRRIDRDLCDARARRELLPRPRHPRKPEARGRGKGKGGGKSEGSAQPAPRPHLQEPRP